MEIIGGPHPVYVRLEAENECVLLVEERCSLKIYLSASAKKAGPEIVCHMFVLSANRQQRRQIRID